MNTPDRPPSGSPTDAVERAVGSPIDPRLSLDVDVRSPLADDILPTFGDNLALKVLSTGLSCLDDPRLVGPAPIVISLVLTDDADIAMLNGEYRGKPYATDVLSFPQLDPLPDGAVPTARAISANAGSAQVLALNDGTAATAPEPVAVDVTLPPRLLGDIVVSLPRVAAQAIEYGHSPQREFGYLLIHSLLHLVGFDHEDPATAPAMRAMEETILAALGLARHADA